MPFVEEYHGTSGPVRTSFNDWQLPLDADIIKACDEVVGMTKKPRDPWSGDHIGFYNTLGNGNVVLTERQAYLTVDRAGCKDGSE